MPVQELHTRSDAAHPTVGNNERAVTLTATETEMFDDIAEAYVHSDQYEADEPRETLRQRMGMKLGRFAARRVIGFASMKESLKGRADNISMAAGVRGSMALMTAAEKAEQGVIKANRAHDKLRDNEQDGTAKRRFKRLGRGAMVAAGLAAVTTAGVLAAKAHEKGLTPLEMSEQVGLAYRGSDIGDGPLIHVPGTGYPAEANTYNGNRVEVGYHASAGPLVEGPSYEVSVAQGVERLFEALEMTGDGVKTIEGYSQGADVIRDAVSQLSEDEQRQLVLNISGDPSGETGVLTLAHDSWQGNLMGALGFDTSPLKSTGAATVNEVRVTNDIMADATYTIADSKKFNEAVDSQDYVTVLRMLAGTVEKAGGYATNHAGMIEVLPEHQVFHDPINPGNATVVSERTPNGTLHVITPNVTALEQVAATHLNLELTPEAREAYTAIINPEVTHDQVVRELGDAAREGIDNTPWIDPNHKPIINQFISGVAEGIAVHHAPVPAVQAPAEAFVAPVVQEPVPAPVPVQPAQPYIAPVAPVIQPYVPPVEVQQFVEQAAPVVNQIANDLQHVAPQFTAEIDHVRNLLQPQQ